MGRAPRKSTTTARAGKSKKKRQSVFDAGNGADGQEEGDLPKDESGRRKIKRQYENLLGIRVEKLKGRILNRERINKTIEGVYFICIRCKKVCHNVDDGLIEDTNNAENMCGSCAKSKGKGKQAAA